MTPGQWVALSDYFRPARFREGDRVELQETEPYPGTITARVRDVFGIVTDEVDVEPDPSEAAR